MWELLPKHRPHQVPRRSPGGFLRALAPRRAAPSAPDAPQAAWAVLAQLAVLVVLEAPAAKVPPASGRPGARGCAADADAQRRRRSGRVFSTPTPGRPLLKARSWDGRKRVKGV